MHTYDQFVAEGREAVLDEKNATTKLMELAAGVEREHGALTRWAEDIGIGQSRAMHLAQAARVNESLGAADLPAVSAATGYELRLVPEKALVQVYEKAVQITAEDRGLPMSEIKAPSQRAARKAAKPYGKKQKRKAKPASELEHKVYVTLSHMRADAIELRDLLTTGFKPSAKMRNYYIRDLQTIMQELELFSTGLVEEDLEKALGELRG